MRILLTNDDGINAPGILQLAERLKDRYEVLIAAPMEQRSAYSHAVTYFRHETYVEEKKIEGVSKAWAIDGTPADCAYLGIYAMDERKPDLVLSGINQGQNLSADIAYSGTIGAACEAIIAGIPAIAMSYCSYTDTDFSVPAAIAEKMIPFYMGLEEKNFVLSVNVPQLPMEEIKGYRVTYPQKPRDFERKLKKTNVTVNGFCISMAEGLPPETVEEIEGTDSYEVSRGYVSLTPIGLDPSIRNGILEEEKVKKMVQNL